MELSITERTKDFCVDGFDFPILSLFFSLPLPLLLLSFLREMLFPSRHVTSPPGTVTYGGEE